MMNILENENFNHNSEESELDSSRLENLSSKSTHNRAKTLKTLNKQQWHSQTIRFGLN